MEPLRLLVPATDENFDEAAYRAANPDVAAAVARGDMPDARAHFEAFGRAEGRELRLAVPDEAKAAKRDRLRRLVVADAIVEERRGVLDCLPASTRRDLDLVPTDNVSAHEYDDRALALIARHRDGLVLDCGAGLRNTYHPNVVNFEIVDYDTTDVLGAAERLPFHDASFDAVLSLNVLEHVKDPFAAAREILRVMKPGAELMAVAPFLQPLHGYPHHYYNMTARGLANLFPALEDARIEVYGAMRPIWSLNWMLQRYADALSPVLRERFASMTVAELMGDPLVLERGAIATDLDPGALTELASAHALHGRKPG